jgi:hypothetical protein
MEKWGGLQKINAPNFRKVQPNFQSSMVGMTAGLGFEMPVTAMSTHQPDLERGVGDIALVESIPMDFGGGHNKPLVNDGLRSHSTSDLPDYPELPQIAVVREMSNFGPESPENAPTVLSWKDLKVTTGPEKNPKVLLNNINGSITG